jgi:Domain of unknown function (DUF4411)
MSNAAPVYVIDSNVLMQAHRLYYAFPICPGFWDCLLRQHNSGRIVSVDKVRGEIQPGDGLHRWVQTSAPTSFFASTKEATVMGNYAALLAWVQQEKQFMQAAKDEFAQVADGWLAAYAQAHKNTWLSRWKSMRPRRRRRSPCQTCAFGLTCHIPTRSQC